MNGLRTGFFVLLILLHPGRSCSHAQGCCTAGASSLGGFETGVLPYKTLTLALNYQYNSLTSAYEGNQMVDDPLRRTATVSYVTMQMEYGLQPRLSLLASLYFSDKVREITVQSGQGTGVFTETVEFRGSGLGDMTLLAKYRLSGSITEPFGLSMGGGMTLPTGSYTEEQDGSQLSIDLQPGTGALSALAWTHAGYRWAEIGLGVYVSGMYRYATANPDGYRLGDEITTGLGAEKGVGEFFTTSLYLRSRFALEDYADGRFLNGTGGTFHDLMASVTYADGPSTFRLFGQVPLYRNVRGIQVTTAYLLGAEYRYSVDFRGVVDAVLPEL